MNAPRLAADYLRDMREAAVKALAFTAGMNWDQFVCDEKIIFAVVRALEIIGEAAKRVPQPIRLLGPSTD